MPEPQEKHAEDGVEFGGSEAGRTAYIQTSYTGRKMKAYCVYDRELEMLSDLNFQSKAFLSAGAWFLGVLATCWMAVLIQGYDSIETHTFQLIKVVSGMCAIVGLGCVVWAICRMLKSRSMLKRIHEESFDVPPRKDE